MKIPDKNPPLTASQGPRTVSLPQTRPIAGIAHPQVAAYNSSRAGTPNTIARLTVQPKIQASKSYGMSASPNVNHPFAGFQSVSSAALGSTAVQKFFFCPEWPKNNEIGQNTAISMVSPTVNRSAPLSGNCPMESVHAQQVSYGSAQLMNPINPQLFSPVVTPAAQWDPSFIKIKTSQGVQMVQVDLRSEEHKNENSLTKRPLEQPTFERPLKASKTYNEDQSQSIKPKSIHVGPTTATYKPFPANIILPKELAFLSAATGAPVESETSNRTAVKTCRSYPSAPSPVDIGAEDGVKDQDDKVDDDNVADGDDYDEEKQDEQESDCENDDDADKDCGRQSAERTKTCLYNTVHHGPFAPDDETTQDEFVRPDLISVTQMQNRHPKEKSPLKTPATTDSGGVQKDIQEPIEHVESANTESFILRRIVGDAGENQKFSAGSDIAVNPGNQPCSSTGPTLLEKGKVEIPLSSSWASIARPPKDLTSNERQDKKTFIRWQRDNARYEVSLGKKGPFEIGHYLCDVDPSNGAILKLEARATNKLPGGSY